MFDDFDHRIETGETSKSSRALIVECMWDTYSTLLREFENSGWNMIPDG